MELAKDRGFLQLQPWGWLHPPARRKTNPTAHFLEAKPALKLPLNEEVKLNVASQQQPLQNPTVNSAATSPLPTSQERLQNPSLARPLLLAPLQTIHSMSKQELFPSHTLSLHTHSANPAV